MATAFESGISRPIFEIYNLQRFLAATAMTIAVGTGVLARSVLAFLSETKGLTVSEILELTSLQPEDRRVDELLHDCRHFPVSLNDLLDALKRYQGKSEGR